MISYEEFKKIEVRAGKILTAEKIPNTDKLLRLTVDFNEYAQHESTNGTNATNIEAVDPLTTNSQLQTPILKPRQIVSGISAYFPDPAVLVGKTCMFVTNLEPRMIKGYESNGMIFAVSNSEGGFSLLEPNSSIKPGDMAA